MINNENFLVLKRIYLCSKKHKNTNNVKVNGSITNYLPHHLEICIYEDMPQEIYLLRLDAEEKTDDCINDTWHPNLQDALEHALYEYNVQIDDWEDA